MSNKDDEIVRVIPTEDFLNIGHFQGLSVEPEKYWPLITDRPPIFMRRGDCEHDPKFKQVIPSCIIGRSSKHGSYSFLEYSRGKDGGESRLHAKRSMTIGGHMNRDDYGRPMEWAGLDPTEAYYRALVRELGEELAISTPTWSLKLVGLINDDENEVGKVHLGFLHLLVIDTIGGVAPREKEIADPTFTWFDEAQDHMERLEPWSQIITKSRERFSIFNRPRPGAHVFSGTTSLTIEALKMEKAK